MVEIMTDKATVEIPAPRAGRVAKLMYAEGQICPVGKVLIAIEVADTAAGDAIAAAGARRTSTWRRRASTGERAPRNNGVNARDAGVLATPATRKLARDVDVDIREVTGSGPGGRITSDDVRAHSGAPRRGARARGGRRHAHPVPGRAPEDRRAPGARRSTRRRTSPTSRRSTAPSWSRCASAPTRAWRRERRRRKVGKLSFLPFIVKATAAALAKFPQLNATLDDAAGEIIQRAHRHIGLATATEAGLIVPVVRDADRLSIVELAGEIERLAALTRTGKAAREDLSGSTFTITSLGALGGLLATPIINHPEVAILGVHKITRRPAVRDDAIVIRDLMNLSISVDHRVVDGYDAARFIAEIKATLETPGPLYPEAS